MRSSPFLFLCGAVFLADAAPQSLPPPSPNLLILPFSPILLFVCALLVLLLLLRGRSPPVPMQAKNSPREWSRRQRYHCERLRRRRPFLSLSVDE